MPALDITYVHHHAHEVLRKAKRVLLVSHPKPDGDTLGAATAMYNWCVRMGINVTGFCLDSVPQQYRYMPGSEKFTNDTAEFVSGRYDVIGVFDAGDLRFAGISALVDAMSPRPFIINFDHHHTNERFGDINIVQTTASSTAEVVYDFLHTVDAGIDRDIATCLLTGICTDTGTFSNAATTWTSLGAASKLLRHGAKIQDVASKLVRNKSLPSLRLWGRVLDRLKYDERTGVSSTAIFAREIAEEGIDEEHVEGISNFLNQFLDTKVVLVLKELPGGKVKGSMRSVDDTDVSLPAKMLGGGGHKKAAGFTVSGKIEEGAQCWRVVANS